MSCTPIPTLSEALLSRLLEDGSATIRNDRWISIKCKAISRSPSASDTHIDVPRFLDSRETLEFLGYTGPVATQIYDNYDSALDQFPRAELLDFAKGRVWAFQEDGSEDPDQWMTQMGVRQYLRNQILDDEFTTIRQTESISYWVKDTFRTKYEHLYKIESIVNSKLATTRGPVALHDRVDNQSTLSGGAIKTETAADQQVTLGSAERTINFDEVELMKGASMSRLSNTIRSSPDEPDEYRVDMIPSTFPSDLSQNVYTVYLSKQREVTKTYALYVQKRYSQEGENYIDVGILHVIVPKELLVNAISLSGIHWQEYVWSNRLRRETPIHLKYLDESPVIIAPLLDCNTLQVERIYAEGGGFKYAQAGEAKIWRDLFTVCFEDRRNIEDYQLPRTALD